jgi:aconitate hydratase
MPSFKTPQVPWLFWEFEAMGLDSVIIDTAVQYVDHNIIQTDFKNADDHQFLRTACAKYGITYSPAGNGISHQVHMERFGVPGKTVIGADSHTPGGGRGSP